MIFSHDAYTEAMRLPWLFMSVPAYRFSSVYDGVDVSVPPAA